MSPHALTTAVKFISDRNGQQLHNCKMQWDSWLAQLGTAVELHEAGAYRGVVAYDPEMGAYHAHRHSDDVGATYTYGRQALAHVLEGTPFWSDLAR